MISNASLGAYSMYCVYLTHMLAYSQEKERRNGNKKSNLTTQRKKERKPVFGSVSCKYSG